MSLGNTHPVRTQSTDARKGVGETHLAKIEIETKIWGKTLIPIQRLELNWCKMQSEPQDFLYSPGDTNGQPKLRNPTKGSLDNTHLFPGKFNWEVIVSCHSKVNLLDLAEQNIAIISYDAL